jgi:hypothetical protein
MDELFDSESESNELRFTQMEDEASEKMILSKK